MPSVEEKVEEHYKRILDSLGIRHYGKTEYINMVITQALKKADSKSGGFGNNFPDIQLLLEDSNSRRIPVMIEAKGCRNRLEKRGKEGKIVGVTYWESDSKTHKKGDLNYSAVQQYAVNGAIHYGEAILDGGTYEEVIVIGINGTEVGVDGSITNPECKAYYLSEKNNRVPKLIDKITATDWSLLKTDNINTLFGMID